MKTVFKAAILLILLHILVACGSKRPPTGGPVDTEKPVVVASVPEVFGDISDGKIEISFSKALDKSTLSSAIYIYPPITNKKISYDANTIIIRIQEKLLKDTNYYVTLTSRLKDTRGNALGQNQTLVFRSGKLNTNKISGSIIYEDPRDMAFPIRLDILSADSLMIQSNSISGNSYAIEHLNPISHLLRAFIDKDNNGRYDFGKEPHFEALAHFAPITTLDIKMQYRDSTLAQIRSVRAISNREVEIQFTEDVSSVGDIAIASVQTSTPLPIRIKLLNKDKMQLITAEQDTSRYQLLVENIRDLKQNLTKRAGTQFSGSSRIATSKPKVVSTSPRNGTSVNSIRPEITVVFDRIMPQDSLRYSLYSADKKEKIAIDVLSGNSNVYKFVPRTELFNYRSYLLLISKDSADIFGNKLEADFELNFLPLYRP